MPLSTTNIFFYCRVCGIVELFVRDDGSVATQPRELRESDLYYFFLFFFTAALAIRDNEGR